MMSYHNVLVSKRKIFLEIKQTTHTMLLVTYITRSNVSRGQHYIYFHGCVL